MEDFDKLWNMGDPAGTETKFREVLAASADKDDSYLLQLQTQLARTYSLRAMFDQAHYLLDTVEKHLAPPNGLAHVRYHLERGRTFNSSGKKPEAAVHFEKAMLIAEELKEDFYTIDAVHMLGIIAPPEDSIKINEAGILLAEQSEDPKAKNWLGALFNNLGWSYFDRGDYEKALSVFLRSLQWRESISAPREIFIAKWCVARALRALNRTDDALTVQLALFEESTTTGWPDGYVHEELGELFLLKNDKLKYPFHFEKAYELLSAEIFLQRNEPARIERIKRLAGLA
jgi:tetratricopeptide (TPR) repeat protein